MDDNPLKIEDTPLQRALAGEQVKDQHLKIIPMGKSLEEALIVSCSGQLLLKPDGSKWGAVLAIQKYDLGWGEEESGGELKCILFTFLLFFLFIFIFIFPLCSLFFVLCSLFFVLCSLFFVLCSLFFVLCSLFFFFLFSFFFFVLFFQYY